MCKSGWLILSTKLWTKKYLSELEKQVPIITISSSKYTKMHFAPIDGFGEMLYTVATKPNSDSNTNISENIK